MTKAAFPLSEPLTANSPNQIAAPVTNGWRTHYHHTGFDLPDYHHPAANFKNIFLARKAAE